MASGMHICDAEFKRIRELEKKNSNARLREKTSSAKDTAPVVSSETLDADKVQLINVLNQNFHEVTGMLCA